MIYELVMKKSAKELDPRHFDPRERRQFDIADQAEWAQWVNNQVMAVVPPHMESKVDAKKIISVPMVRPDQREAHWPLRVALPWPQIRILL